MPGRALVFDYDGLIVDSETPEYLCWKRVFEEHGLALPPEEWARVIGGAEVVNLREQLEARLGRRLDWDAIEPRRIAHHRELFEAQSLRPGVRELMECARRKGYGVGIASNSNEAWVRDGVARFGLHAWVTALRGRDTARRPKPKPDPYLEVLAELKAVPAGSFAFEDSATGVAAAKAAGLYTVAVPNWLTRLHDLSGADLVLESLEHFSLPD